MSNLNPTHPYPAGRSAVAAPLLASVLTLAAWMPAGPAAAAILNYSIANPAAGGWTGGALTIGSLSDLISILPSLITGTVNGVTSSFVPDFVGNTTDELWYSKVGGGEPGSVQQGFWFPDEYPRDYLAEYHHHPWRHLCE